MNAQDLLELKEGRMSFDAFFRKHCQRLERMALHFYNRAKWAHLPLEPQDLVQIGAAACWTAVREYLYGCPVCRRWARSPEDLAAHGRVRHGGADLEARPSLYQWCFGQVGSAMDHEVTKHVRREKWAGEMPEDERSTPAVQEHAAELALLVARAEEQLAPTQAAVLYAMIAERPVTDEFPGLSPSGARRAAREASQEVLESFIRPRAEEGSRRCA